jgi:hypothetical protein
MSMQFDQQRIAIRERPIVEIFDLALAVLRERGIALLKAFTAGAVPAMLLNGLVLYALLDIKTFDSENGDDQVGYLYLMLLLVVFEAPLATAPLTIYLGQTLFQDRPTGRQVAIDFWRALPQLLCYQFFLRGFWCIFQFTAIVPYWLSPYLNEIILLEKNPLRARIPRGVTTSIRSGMLHGASRSMLFGRWLVSVMCGTVMAFALFFALWSILSKLAGHWLSDEVAYLVLWPIALWSVIGFFTVVRFLAYLDLRIRHEGWEVELLMRAEAGRLGRQLV